MTAFFKAGSRGLVVARPIHNLKVPGSNLEVGSIFSKRYLARKGFKKREKENWMERNWDGGLGLGRVGKVIFFHVT